MEKQKANEKVLEQEQKTTAGKIAEEIRILTEDEFICKACAAEENGFTLSLFNGQKFRVCVTEL